MAYRPTLVVSLLLLSTACSDSASVQCSASAANTVAASIDGVNYCGSVDAAFTEIGNLNVASSSATLELNFGTIAAVGTRTIGLGSGLSFHLEDNSGAIWNASEQLGSGSLTVVTLANGTATGNFSFNAQPVSGSTVARNVTTGTFIVSYEVR